MTIASEANRSGPYACNGATTHFPFSFRIYDEAHVRVILTNPQGMETTLRLGTDYTASGVGQSGGGAIDTAIAYASGYRVTLILNVPFTQTVDLENQGAYFAETIERAIDLQTQMSLQLKEQVARAVVLPVTSSVSVDTLTGAVLSLSEIQPQMQTLVPIAEDIVTVAGIAGAVVAAEGNANTATAAATLATGKAAEAAASAAAAALFDTANYYPKTAFRIDGTASAPLMTGAIGETAVQMLRIKGPEATQRRIEFWNSTELRWVLYRDVDDTFSLWSTASGTALRIDPTTNRVNFSALPTVAGFNLLYLDGDGKLPAYDGSKLTNLPIPGVGQTLSDVTASRAIGTMYQNTTNKIVFVLAYTVATGGGSGVAWNLGPTATPGSVGGTVMTNGWGLYSVLPVPPGWYYQMAASNYYIAAWREIR